MNFRNNDKDGLFKSIFTAYFILLLHVFLLAGAGVTVVLFRGVYHYLPWIMACLGILVLAIAWFFYRRMRQGSSDIKDLLSLPEFRDRTVEVKLLGGLASFKISSREDQQMKIGHTRSDQRLIENDIHSTEQKIVRLAALFEKNLITQDEFDKAKQDLIQG